MGNSSTSLDAKDRELLEQIGKKVLNSPALNGGFDRLVVTVGQIKERQDEAIEKIDDLSKALYQPKEGLYSKVQALEYDVQTVNKTMTDHFEKDEKNFVEFNASITKLEDNIEMIDKSISTTEKLKKIAGNDLEDINDLVRLKRNVTKILWALITLVVLGVVKLIWELAKKQ